MARRKNAVQEKSASARTSAAIFNEVESPEQLDSPVSNEPTPETQPEPPVEDAKFPFNLIIDFIDLVTETMSVQKGVQFMVCFYLTQIFYIYYKDKNIDVVYSVAFSLMGALLAMYLSHRSLKKKYEADPTNRRPPQLPDFNSLYSLFIPYSFVLLMSDLKDPFFQVNLSMANFCIKSLHPVAKVLSSFVYYYMYNDSQTVEMFEFAKVVWIYFMIDYVLREWNAEPADEEGKEPRTTLDDAEIHLVAIFFVNLFENFRIPVSEATLPIVLVRVMAIALLGACGIAFPIYYCRQLLEDGVLKSILSYVTVAAYGGVFYWLTEYLFKMQINKEGAVSWLYYYVKASELRTHLIAVWVGSLVVILPIVLVLSEKNVISLNLRRKIWHFALVGCLAYPALVKEPVLSSIAVLGSIFLFITLELLRCTRLTVIGELINSGMHVFQDEKDLKGPLSLSYIFLLVGVAIPIGYGVIYEDVVSIRSYLGLVFLGVGDSLASIIGKNFGRVKWRNSSRTVEGTVVYIVSTFAALVAVDFYLLPEAARVKNWENVFIVTIIAGLLEGAASLNDNVLIPCVSLIAYEVLSKVF